MWGARAARQYLARWCALLAPRPAKRMLYRVLLVEAHKRGSARAHNLVKRERVLHTRHACQRMRRARHAAGQRADGARARRTGGGRTSPITPGLPFTTAVARSSRSAAANAERRENARMRPAALQKIRRVLAHEHAHEHQEHA